MPRKILLPCAVLIASLSLSGCGFLFGDDGYFRDRGDDYLRAEPIAPLKVPAGVSGENIGQLFVIPPIAETGSAMPETFDVPRPVGGELVAGQRNEVKIQKLGERRWITVNAAPGAVWPRVRQFLDARGLSLSVLDPSMGMLETGWLTIKDDPDNKDRYRIRLEQGLRGGVTEIHVLQMTVSQRVPGSGQVNWPEKSLNPDREAWMINELAAHLAKEDTTQASMLAQAIGSGDRKVELVPADSGEAHLLMHVDHARAWASVGGALNRNGFQIETTERERNLWQVSYSSERVEAEQEDDSSPGIFARLGKAFGFGEDRSDTAAAHYQVMLVETADGSVLTVRAPDGQPLSPRETDKLLRLIQSSLL